MKKDLNEWAYWRLTLISLLNAELLLMPYADADACVIIRILFLLSVYFFLAINIYYKVFEIKYHIL